MLPSQELLQELGRLSGASAVGGVIAAVTTIYVTASKNKAKNDSDRLNAPSKMNASLADLQSSISEASKELLHELRAEIKEARDKAETANERAENYFQQVRTLNSEVAALKKEHAECRQSEKVLAEENARLNKRIDALEQLLAAHGITTKPSQPRKKADG